MTANRLVLSGGEVRPILMEIQQGRCGACPSEGPFVVDHDHETGRVRGLLCKGCNSREGKIRSGMFMTEADEGLLAYLADPPAAPFGWFWEYPDPRMNPARMAADTERAIRLLQTIKLPLLDGSAESSPEPAELEAVPPQPEPDRLIMGPRSISIEEAIAELQTIRLPPLDGVL